MIWWDLLIVLAGEALSKKGGNGSSRSSDDKGALEVLVDDERGEYIGPADSVLLRVDKFGEHLVEVELRLGGTSLFLQKEFALQLRLELHDQVETVAVHLLKHEDV